jgi:HEAT repeat protein
LDPQGAIGDGQVSWDESGRALIKHYLEASDGETALKALEALGRARVGLSHLWDTAEHRLSRFRSTAFRAMANFRPEDAVGSEPFVRRGLDDDNSYVVAAAARAAAALRIVETVPRLRQLAIGENRHTRGAACLALGSVGDHEDFPLLIDVALRDHNDRVVERAARALGQLCSRHTPPPDFDLTIIALLDRISLLSGPVRWRATRGIVSCAVHIRFGEQVNQRLLTMLQSDAGVRGDIARALGYQDVQAARPIIEAYLASEPSSRLRGQLLRAIHALGAEPSLPALVSLTELPLETTTARALIEVLGSIPDDSAHAPILRLARGPDIAVRPTAFKLLPPSHPLRLDLALAGLSDAAAPVRREAALALADRPDLADALQNALAHETIPDVREAISFALESARAAPPPEDPVAESAISAQLLARVPITAGPPGEAVRLVVLDVIAQGGDEAAIVNALESLVQEAEAAATQFRTTPTSRT